MNSSAKPHPRPRSHRGGATRVALALAFATPSAAAQIAPDAPAGPAQDAPASVLTLEEVVVDRDDFVLERSARVVFPAEPIVDAAGDGVLRIHGEGLVVDLSGSHLRGAPPEVEPDGYAGIGIVVEGTGVTLRGARVSGFRVGVEARGVDGLVIEDADVSDNFRQRLGSTPEREDPSDWLWPHDNDDGEWVERYGAGLHVKGARDVTVRRCRARDGQNGLVLDRVDDGRFYDNDFSFLSGWGIAMWRSSRNSIQHNSLDFCVRGYSHGVYNRGQDSAGLLMFEQCNDNVVAFNSMTHGGDGIFGFAGKEALGDVPGPEGFDHARKGCNRNTFFRNELSYAAAHGYEMTFSFRNTVYGNRMIGNAICGVWAGYSQDSVYSANVLAQNGEGAYGSERGGINIEHGKGNLIQFNRFVENACGIRVWWDPDPHLADKPWVRANGFECGATAIYSNLHVRDEVGLEIDGCPDVQVSVNRYESCGTDVVAEGDDVPSMEPVALTPPPPPRFEELGERDALSLRQHLRGREHIVLTEWGPYDWERPLLARGVDTDGVHVWRLLGVDAEELGVTVEALGQVGAAAELTEADGERRVLVRPDGAGLFAYGLRVTLPGGDTLEATRRELRTRWDVRAFESPVDPREDVEAWRAAADGGLAFQVDALDLPLGGGGLASVPALAGVVGLDALPSDRLGLVARTRVGLPAGTYRLTTTSDDGIRVRVDGEVVVEDWTHHGATPHEATLTFDEAGEHELVVEWFELDGGAVLTVDLAPAE